MFGDADLFNFNSEAMFLKSPVLCVILWLFFQCYVCMYIYIQVILLLFLVSMLVENLSTIENCITEKKLTMSNIYRKKDSNANLKPKLELSTIERGMVLFTRYPPAP